MPLDGVRKIRVDATDIAVVRDLVKAGSGSFHSQNVTVEAVAKGLGLHPNTVFARIKRMEDAGWLLPMTILPVPTVVGYSLGRFFVPMPLARRTEALLAEVMKFPCFYVADMVEGWEPCLMARDDATLEALAEKVTRLLGGEKVDWMIHTGRDWPALPHFDLDETDLPILEALLANPHASMDKLAARLGLNPRKVQRHHERLRDAGAFRIYPCGRGAMSTGMSLLHLQMRLPDPGPKRREAEAAIDRLLPNVFARQGLVGGVWFVVYGDEPGELQLQAERVAAVPGVTIVVNRQMRRYAMNPDYPTQVMELLRAKVFKTAVAANR